MAAEPWPEACHLLGLLPKKPQLENALAIYHCNPSTAMRLHVPGVLRHMTSSVEAGHPRSLFQTAVVVFFTLVF